MAEALAVAIVRGIERDLRDQPGLDQAWEALGAAGQHQVLERWAHLADGHIKSAVLRLLDAPGG